MIKFFRRIRQRLLTENKFSKYLIYAIGEILLVVIGILIALSINNWNQNRINQKSEIKILKELKSDFESNYMEIESIIARVDRLHKVTDSILYLLDNQISIENQIELLNNMGGFMGFLGGNGGIFNSANTSYKYLESTGINSINNDSIRISITEMFEKYFKNIHVREEMYKTFYANEYEPLVNKYFEFDKTESRKAFISKVNLSSTADYIMFKNIIIKKLTYEEFRLKRLNEILGKLGKLIDDLKLEIVSLEE